MARFGAPILLLLVGASAIADASDHGKPRGGELAWIFVRESVFNHLIIRRDGSIVSFRRLENGGTVSAIDLDNPRRQVIPYTATLFAPALVKCCPSSVLNLGLGAGAFDRLFETAFPQSRLVSVEIDPMVVEVAETYTAFRRGPKAEVVIADGRRYLSQSRGPWDWIVLDAYVRKSRIPVHLTTREFFELARSRLSPGGIFVVNVVGSGSAFFQSYLKTLTVVFGQVAFFPVRERPNVIALGVAFKDPDLMKLIGEADPARLPNLAAWGVDFPAIQKSAVPASAYPIPPTTRVLTDDFAPVEILDARPAR